MADIVVPSAQWVPPGGIVTLSSPDQRIVPAAGLTRATILGGIFIENSAVGAVVGGNIKLAPPTSFAAAGVIQCAASKAQLHCEIDCNNLPIQGLQLIRWPATAGTPDDVNLDGLYVYNNALGNDPGGVGFNHGIYFQDSVRATGKNLRFIDIRGGRALHFYPRAKDSRISQVTDVRCFGDVVFWGDAVTGNQVSKLLSLQVGTRGVVEWGGGAVPATNTLDYKTAATAGYGYQAAVVPPPSTVPPVSDVAGAKAKLAAAQTALADALKLLG